tara:strand:- start:9657 stop:11150 length:1494 start_codon:yes stop_codon:yes gene_type:complete
MEYLNSKIEILRSVSPIANSLINVDELVSMVINITTRVMDARASSLLLVDEKGKKLQFYMASGEKIRSLKKIELNVGEGIAGWVAEKGEPLLVKDVHKDKRWSRKIGEMMQVGVKSIACCPMKVNGKIIGVVEILDRKDGSPIQDEQMETLCSFTELVSTFFENSKQLDIMSWQNRYLKKQLESRYEIIGDSAAIKKVIGHALKVANSKVSTLIVGESGTGKELIARLVHQRGSRKENPFVSISCGALPETLMERELYGNEKGAFTGADSQKIGLFEAADKGTLFLDEIGEMPIAMQVKLLRVLQEGVFMRVGGTRSVSVDVRVIAATHRNIKKMTSEGKFREDLYYRLNVVEINIPPLRERKEDIEKLVFYFIKRHQMEMNLPENFSVPEETIEFIKNYHWPGNIRQLENAIERALIMGDGKELRKGDLPKDVEDAESETVEAGKSLKDAQDIFKKSYVIKTLEQLGGNRTRAAEVLEIQRTYLSRLIKELGIDFQ